MKRLILVLLITATSLSMSLFKAQVNVNININSQPDWGPKGYNYVESYYLPQYDIYYNVPQHRYYYFSGNRWLFSRTLPVRHRHINLYQTRKIVLVDRYPYKRHPIHYKQYARYRVNHHSTLVAKNNNGHHYKAKSFKKNFRNRHYQPSNRRFAKVGNSQKKGFYQKNFNHSKQNKHQSNGSHRHR